MRFLLLLLFPIQALAINLDFYKDGVPETVMIDTAVPANTLAYPIGYFDTTGVQVDLATEATLSLLEGKDFATETTLLLLEGKDFATETTLQSIDGKDFATQTTLNNMYLQSLGQSALQTQIETNTAGVFNATGSSGAGVPGRVMQVGGRDGSGDLQPLAVTAAGLLQVEVSSSGLPMGAATEATLSALNTKHNANFGSDSGGIRVNAQVGSSAGPADFGAGNAGSNTLRTVIATDQSALPAAQSGTWTVQPGNTANTTPWLVNTRMPAVTVKQAAITVGTSAVRLTTDASAPTATRQRLEFQHDAATSTGSCYYGSASVTSSGGTRGVLFYPGATKELLNDANDYYAICTAASQTIFVVEAE